MVNLYFRKISTAVCDEWTQGSEIMQEEKAGHVFGGYVRGVQAKDSCERKGGAGFEKH